MAHDFFDNNYKVFFRSVRKEDLANGLDKTLCVFDIDTTSLDATTKAVSNITKHKEISLEIWKNDSKIVWIDGVNITSNLDNAEVSAYIKRISK